MALESLDYSFAVEYLGPPLPYDIPQAIPIDIDHIPLASVAPSSSSSPLPVVQPLLPSPKPLVVSPTSVIAFDPADSGPCDHPDSSSDLKASADLSSEFGFRSDDDAAAHPSSRRPVAVTFEDEATDDGTDGCLPPLEPPAPRPPPKKGACYRCCKGNRFTEKEICIVCSAKYCANCVLRAMGSMPEGRKCITCIGYPIEESRRDGLGKCSRMLKRLLSSLEVEQVMKAERYCEANQLRAEDVYVNGRPLSHDEMISLKTCSNPPSKLTPGYYWYDRVSGLWGKEGLKPHLIISPHLNIGGSLLANASNGNTGVFINGRNVTKAELRMLKYAGVQCAGNPHFWVNSDGTYQEEGMKNVKGNLWGKHRMKLVCSILSLPHPSKMSNPCGEVDDIINGSHEYFEKRSLQKLLLLGCRGSGTDTILKQAKFLYKPVPFSDEEREIIKVMIQTSIYQYLCVLLEGRERFEEECLANRKDPSLTEEKKLENECGDSDDKTLYSISPRLKVFSDWLLKVMASGNLEAIFPAATREYAPLVEELWKDPAIQAAYDRRKELQNLPTSASYFLERVVDISRLEYEPSDTDILYADGVTSSNSLSYTEFTFPHAAYDCSDIDDANQHETVFRYQLIRVQMANPLENCKWLEMFEDVRLVIFCVALSDYDEQCEDPSGETINKMVASKRLFESIISHPSFEEMGFVLIMNKFDLLEKKIEAVPLNACDWFDDFNPVISHQQPNKNSGSNSRGSSKGATPGEQAFHYMAVKFKKLYASVTGRKLYVTMTNGLDKESVDRALRYAREVSKWEDERETVFGTGGDCSAYSTDPSSLSD